MKAISINGRFLKKKVTGTERFAREIVWALDKLLSVTPNAPMVTILAPRGTPVPESLLAIKFKTCGRLQGHAWEQGELPYYACATRLVGLTNTGPVFHADQIVVMHDISVFRLPQNFSFVYRAFQQVLGRLLSHRVRLATVSDFSRREIEGFFGLRDRSVSILSNGHEHILLPKADESILPRLNLKRGKYFLFVGSLAYNKNLNRAIQAFASLRRSDIHFVLVGSANTKIFKTDKQVLPPRVLAPGRLTDKEIAGLYKNALALVFPSLYEGFGIPPLEAMVYACPVLASDIPPVKEVCGDVALYFNPYDVADMARRMEDILSSPAWAADLAHKASTHYAQFSWADSAAKLFSLLTKYNEIK